MPLTEISPLIPSRKSMPNPSFPSCRAFSAWEGMRPPVFVKQKNWFGSVCLRPPLAQRSLPSKSCADLGGRKTVSGASDGGLRDREMSNFRASATKRFPTPIF